MTIRLLQAFDGIPAQAIVTLDTATEDALIRNGTATLNLTGGYAWESNDPFDINPQPEYIYGESVQLERFGMVPGADPDTNSAAITAAFAIGGSVTLMRKGTYTINTLPDVPDGSGLFIGPGVTLVEA